MDDTHDVETPDAIFGAELRRLRVHAGLTVRGLAEELHRAHSGISDFENGVRLPSVEVVEQYEDRFGLQRGALISQREHARAKGRELPRDGTIGEHLGEVVCPYKGLQAFEHEDAALFFGRETEVQEAVARLTEERFLAVVGASGSGKSSFVRAGLLAGIGVAAHGATSAPIVVLTPGEHPVEELATAAGASGGAGLVIFVDQFEELFTLCHDHDERRRFIDALVAAWRDPSGRAAVVIALRADFYGRVAAYPELAAAIVANQTLIGPMSSADLRRAIELPAARCGLQLQPGLAQTMLEDLADEPGALPLLSHALLETWKRRRRLMLTVGGYHEAGGVRGAIAQTADATLKRLPEADRVIARSIFLSLTDVGEGAEPTRRRVDHAELAMGPHSMQSIDRVLNLLAGARLVTIEERTVAVAHEALIRHWPRLRRWLDEDREDLLTHRRLADAANQWHSEDHEPAALYRGTRLAAARDWAQGHGSELSRLERHFLTTSASAEHDALDASRRRTRRLRVLACGLAALTTIVAVLALWALEQRNTAHRQTAAATSLALASAALPLAERQPHVSLILALEANRASPRPEARASAIAALTAARDRGVRAILHGHTDNVLGVAFSPDGRMLASASQDDSIRLWDVKTRRPLGAPLTGHAAGAGSVAFSPDGRTLASAGESGTIRFWDARTHEPRGTPLTGHAGSVNAIAFSPDGRMLASAGDDQTVRLWDARTHAALGAPLTGHASSVHSVAFHPGGHTLATGGGKTIRLWDVRTRRPLGKPLTGHTLGGLVVAFSRDGRTLASGSYDRAVRLWDVRTRRPLGRPLTGHTSFVLGVAFSHDGRTLASGSHDRTIRLWNVRTRRPLGEPLTGHTGPIRSVAFGRDGSTLASASHDDTIRLWDVRAPTSLAARLTGHTGSVNSVAFSHGGRTLASGGDDKTIRLWDARTHRAVGRALTGHAGSVRSVAFSGDDRTLASGGDDATVRVWDRRTRRPLGPPLAGHTGTVRSVAFSRDGRMLASAASVKIHLWDARTRRPLGPPLTGHSGRVNSVAFSRDGRTLASGSSDGTIRLWDVRTHEQLGAALLTRSSIEGVALSSDGLTLASSSYDPTIRFWDLRSHRSLGQPLIDDDHFVASVAFSPDANTLASGSFDKTIGLWDVRSHKSLGALMTGHPVHSVAFSPDGRSLASANKDDTVRLWEKILWRDFAELEAQVCDLVGRGLGTAEWAQHAAGISHRRSCG